MNNKEQCAICNGTGNTMTGDHGRSEENCGYCNGTGEKTVRKTVGMIRKDKENDK